MAIQRNPLQAIKGNAPQPQREEDGFWEWLGKTAVDRSLQGLVSAGSEILVEHATDELKTNRQIKVGAANAKATHDLAMHREGTKGVRAAITDYENRDTNIAQAEFEANQLEAKIASAMEGGSVSKAYFDEEDYLTLMDGLGNKAAEQQKNLLEFLVKHDAEPGDALALSQQTSDVNNKELASAWGQFDGRIKNIRRSYQKMRDPEKAAAQIREAVKEFKGSIGAIRKRSNRMFTERLLFEQQQAGVDEHGKQRITVDTEALGKWLQGRSYVAKARVMEGERRRHILKNVGTDEYLRLEKTGEIHQRHAADETFIPSVDPRDPAWKTYGHHLSPALRSMLGVSGIKSPESHTRSFLTGDYIDPKHMSAGDKEDRKINLMFFEKPPDAKSAFAVAKKNMGVAGRTDGPIYDPVEIARFIEQSTSAAKNWGALRAMQRSGMSKEDQEKLDERMRLQVAAGDADVMKNVVPATQSPNRFFDAPSVPARRAETEERPGRKEAEQPVETLDLSAPVQSRKRESPLPSVHRTLDSAATRYLRFVNTNTSGE